MDEDDFLDRYIAASDPSQCYDYFTGLPLDLIEKICSYLSMPTLIHTISPISHHFSQVSHLHSLWQTYFFERFDLEKESNNVDWKAKFMERYLVERKLSGAQLSYYELSPGKFDLLSTSGQYVVAHPLSDELAGDIIHVWDLSSRKMKSISADYTTPTCAEIFNNELFIGTTQGDVYVYDIKSRHTKLVLSANFKGSKKVSSICCDYNKEIFVGYSDGSIGLWKRNVPEPIILNQHFNAVKKITIIGDKFITLASDGFRVWDYNTGRVVLQNNDKVSCMETYGSILYCGQDNSITCWDLNTYQLIFTQITFAPLKQILLSPNWIITIEERRLVLPNTSNLGLYSRSPSSDIQPVFLNVGAFPVVAIALYCNYYFISGHSNGTICIWTTQGKLLRKIFPEAMNPLFSVNSTESGIILTKKNNLSYCCWAEPSWKRKYEEYEQLTHSPIPIQSPHKRMKLDNGTNNGEDVLSFWELKRKDKQN